MSRQYGYYDSSYLNFHSGMRQEDSFRPSYYAGGHPSVCGYQIQNGFHRQDDYFPSSSREHQERVPSAAPLTQFNSPAHNFTQHLRERSPSSSSALLNLLQRYPSARQSVYSGRIFPAEEVAVDRQIFRPADASTGYPLVEVAVPKQTAAEIQRPYPGPPDQHLPSFSNGYSTFSNRNEGFGCFPNYSQGKTREYGQTFPRNSFERRDFDHEVHQFPQSNYNDPDVDSHLSQRNNWPAALDIDSLLGVAENTMNKSTAEWKRSFAQMQERFQQSPGPTESFSQGFPSRGLLTKSSSHNEIHDRSLLGNAVERAQEAPEFQRSVTLNGFWSATVDRRPSPPSIQRLRTTLTAAERLQLLHEPIEKSRSYTPAPVVPQRVGSRSALAARREKYLQEASSPPTTPKEVGAPQPLSPRSVPNFSDLDSAVQELQNGIRQTGYSLGARHLGGCGRFPTDYTNLSPPRLVSRKYTPSPETVSESSSAYQVPNGLPHPKPKHNIKEQIYQASVQTNFLPRSGLRPSPNFPVPSTGSVASRITEFEKRPGTPTLHIANNHHIPFQSGPMSHGNAVFRSKPTIHVDIGPSYHRPSQQANTVFSFESPSTPKEDTLNRLTEQFGALAIQTPLKQRESPLPKPNFDLNLSGSDASNCSNDSSYGFNNLSVNKAIRELLHNEQDLAASPIVPKKPKIPPPNFYFPQGKPVSQAENTAALRRGLEVFRLLPGNVCNYENMDQLCQAVGLPVYWKKPMFSSISIGGRALTLTDFSAYWAAMTSVSHDEAARFVYTLTGGKSTEIKRENLRPLINDVILTHPGLAFYRTSVEFHDKYCDVVITRIFWNHRRTWARHITAEDLRRGDFLEAVRQLEFEEDINKSLRYFSYEHFYVVYCLFWEIDRDHTLRIKPEDLGRHQRGAIPRRVVDRVFSRAVSKQPIHKARELGLVEFTQFLLADEDKQHPSSIDYWFRIMDEDADGVISLYDMENYFSGIQEKLAEEGIDCMKFSDVACHLIDAIQPKKQNSFRRSDFMNNKLSPKFFNSFVNFRKFYYQETTEGSEPRLEDASGQELTDWDRFCVEEYEALMEQSEAENVDSYDLYLEDDEETKAGSGTYNELL